MFSNGGLDANWLVQARRADRHHRRRAVRDSHHQGICRPAGVRAGLPAGRRAGDAGDIVTQQASRGLHMTSEELRNYATVIAALVALLVFVVNVWSQSRNRRIENISRFNQVHQRLFASDGYLSTNLIAIELRTMKRDLSDLQMEAKFHLMLLEIERLAILANNRAVPRLTQVYLFGSYAPTILDLMTDEERKSIFWELASGYLIRIASDAERYARLTASERERFWR